MTRRSEYDDDPFPTERCHLCALADPHARTRHHLALVLGDNLDLLRQHLQAAYVVGRDLSKQRPDIVDNICQWVANLITQFSHMADETTGAPLPWHEARRQMAGHTQFIAGMAYERAPEKYRAQAEGREVQGFGRVRHTPMPPGTPFPDEPPYHARACPVAYASHPESLFSDDREELWE